MNEVFGSYAQREFDDFSEDEKARALDKAVKWRRKHQEHVTKIERLHREACYPIYPPCGSDIFRPELWTPAHWRWLREEEDRKSVLDRRG